jgi:hypothetical protein
VERVNCTLDRDKKGMNENSLRKEASKRSSSVDKIAITMHFG